MIRVLIAEDMEPVRRRYARILSADDEIEIVGQVGTGKETVEQATLFHPDVILLDVEMETRTAGLDAAQQILGNPQTCMTKIIILTVYEDDNTVFQAFQAGVTDYVLKNSPPEEIITCVKDAYKNLSPIRPAIAKKIRDEFLRLKKSENQLLSCMQNMTMLTQTELDILNLTMEGYSRQQICEIRCVELSTVKSQIHSILRKFEKNSMKELVTMLEELHVFEYFHKQPHKDPY